MEEFRPAGKNKKRKNKISVDRSHLQLQQILDVKLDICSSQFYTGTIETLKQKVEEKYVAGNQPLLICYGLGNFADSYIARYQLALLLALRDDLQITPNHCEVYDPLFTSDECLLLTELNFKLLEVNEEGKRECMRDSLTIFYMPHCGKALYNNLLWKNWGQLQNVVIVGNSFTHMIDSTPTRILEKTANYVIKITPYTKEIPLQVSTDYDDVFNDTSIHTFITHCHEDVPEQFWEDKVEPTYDRSDAEIIFR